MYVSLHSADPQGFVGANEIPVARLPVQLVRRRRILRNKRKLDFENMPATVVTHVAIWNAPTGGAVLKAGPFADPVETEEGDTFRIAAGDLEAEP